jgi:1-acyl-sn-glycerol-3-phosphate acyltransferase
MDMTRLLLPLRHLYEYTALIVGYAILGAGCLLWTLIAFPLTLVMPGHRGIWLGRRVATLGFRAYLLTVHILGAARFDIGTLDSLREEEPLIIVANHPGLLDALMVVSRLPNVACVIKGSLFDSPLWGAGARLAGYIRNDWHSGSIKLAIEELKSGCQLLYFPEGTRTETLPLGEFRFGPAYISHRAGVPIQTVFIEQDTGFLGKDWHLLRRPDLPMRFRMRLGRRFDPPADPREFTEALHEYFLGELSTTPFQGMTHVG